MKNTIYLIISLSILSFSSVAVAQGVSLGNDENTVYNILYDRVNGYNNSQGDHDQQSFFAKRYNGDVIEIIISMRDGYFYDLGLNSDYAIHYVMNNGHLDYILTEFINLSVDQLKSGFKRTYGDKQIDDYYFSDNYNTYKTIFLSDNGIATVSEKSTYNTKFPPKINNILFKMGIANRFLPVINKTGNTSQVFTHLDEKNPFNNVRFNNRLTALDIKHQYPNLTKLLDELKLHFNSLIINRKGEDNALATAVGYSYFGRQKIGSKIIPQYYVGYITNFKAGCDEFYIIPNSDTVIRHSYTFYLCPFGFSSSEKNGVRIFKNKEETQFSTLKIN